MKKNLFFLILFFTVQVAVGQKFGYIDTEYITNKMPEYKVALENMNQYSEKWVQDIKGKYDELEKLKMKFQQEEILLTAEMKREKLALIEEKEIEIKKLNDSIFGLNGVLFEKKKELLKPILDEVYKASEKVARQKKLMFIFDKASDLSMIYTDPRHDYTDFVLEELGLNNKGPIKK
jgi:outer membrane protein